MIYFLKLNCQILNSFEKTFGQTFIKNDSFLSIVGSVSSFFNALGRLLWGYLVDKLCYKVYKAIPKNF